MALVTVLCVSSPPLAAAHPLATANAALNATATLLLVVGYILIRRHRETAHKWTMLAAFAVSVVFLTCYLAYHVWPVGARAVPFGGAGPIRTLYYTILISHIILAAVVPFLAIVTICYALADRRGKHNRLARWTLPIWLYVSVTGVVIYYMLYHLYPAV